VTPEQNNANRLKALRDDYKKTFETEEGKRVLKDLEQNCFYRSTTLEKEAIGIAFNEGSRAVFLRIINLIDLDIEALEKAAA
jgi:hypothetical protein